MNNSEIIRTVKVENCNKVKEKSSQFLGYVYHITSVNEAEEKLKNIKKQFYDANHHCYAYKLASDVEKYSDDGEPNGTAGLRILNAINHFSLSDVLVIVVRYFGGTKLGVGLLGKTYYNTSYSLLESSKIVELRKFVQFEIEYNFEDVNKIYTTLNKFNCQKITEKFDKFPTISCFIEPYKIPNFSEELSQITLGKARLSHNNVQIYLTLN